MSFLSEAEMSRHFRDAFAPVMTTNGIEWVDEFDGLFGVPDYVLFKWTNRRVLYMVSIELKLRDWRRGLTQAFRYRTFSNEVFLVLDEHHVGPALRHRELFERANIGLASYNRDGAFNVHSVPEPAVPFSSEFSERAVSRLLKRSANLPTEVRNLAPTPAFARTVRGRFPVGSYSSTTP